MQRLHNDTRMATTAPQLEHFKFGLFRLLVTLSHIYTRESRESCVLTFIFHRWGLQLFQSAAWDSRGLPRLTAIAQRHWSRHTNPYRRYHRHPRHRRWACNAWSFHSATFLHFYRVVDVRHAISREPFWSSGNFDSFLSFIHPFWFLYIPCCWLWEYGGIEVLETPKLFFHIFFNTSCKYIIYI